MIVERPTEMQLDALREVANIGCAHAATALSRMVGDRRVSIDVPSVRVMPLSSVVDSVGGPRAPVISAVLEMTSGLNGWLLLVLPEADAIRLCSLLLNAPPDPVLSEGQRSAFAEVANVIASACLSAIGQFTGFRLIPSIPTLIHDFAGDVVQVVLERGRGLGHEVLVMEARFSAAHSPPIEGRMLVLPDAPSLAQLLARLGM